MIKCIATSVLHRHVFYTSMHINCDNEQLESLLNQKKNALTNNEASNSKNSTEDATRMRGVENIRFVSISVPTMWLR